MATVLFEYPEFLGEIEDDEQEGVDTHLLDDRTVSEYMIDIGKQRGRKKHLQGRQSEMLDQLQESLTVVYLEDDALVQNVTDDARTDTGTDGSQKDASRDIRFTEFTQKHVKKRYIDRSGSQ